MDGLSLNLSWKRLLILGALLLAYFLLGGFTPPEFSGIGPVRDTMMRNWIYMISIFCMGSISTTLIDHKFGLFPPVNIRPLYIILGVLLMISSLLWMYSVRSDPAGASSPSAPLFRSSTPSPF